MAIRGISLEKGSMLVNNFPTMKSFLNHFDRLPDNEARVKYLKGLNANIPSKCLNDAVCRRIVSLFYDEIYQN